jgi:ABC-type sulfate transport system permease subunit
VSYVDRVAEQALKIKPVKLLLSLLALPFYVLGLVAGLVVVVFVFAYAGVKTGVRDVRSHLERAGGGDRAD